MTKGFEECKKVREGEKRAGKRGPNLINQNGEVKKWA